MRLVFRAAGLALLGLILHAIDLEAVGRQVRDVGWRVLWILALFFVAFLADTISWQLVLSRLRLSLATLIIAETINMLSLVRIGIFFVPSGRSELTPEAACG